MIPTLAAAAKLAAQPLRYMAKQLTVFAETLEPDSAPTPPPNPPAPPAAAAEKAAAPPAAPSKPEMVTEADQVVDNLRATATTIIKLLTAVAAIIVAGTSFSNLGKLTAPDWMEDSRLQVAFATGGLALAMIGFVIWQATRVLTTGAVSLDDLADPKDSDANQTLADYVLKMGVLEKDETTLKMFLDKRIQLRDDVQANSAALRALERREIVTPDDPALTAAAKEATFDLTRSVNDLTAISLRTRVMLAGLRARIVGQTMKTASIWMTIAGVVGGISLGGFVWAANPPDDEPDPFLTPVEVVVELTEDESGRYDSRLGADCVAAEFRAIVLSVDDDTAKIISLASAACRVAEIDVSLGSIRPAGTVIATPAASPAAATPSPEAE